MPDAWVVGSGPNGLSAAIELARNGLRVEVLEAEAVPGGAARTLELTIPGFRHDFGSAVHPLAAGSPFFSELDLDGAGLEWIEPPACVAHPFDDGTAVLLLRSVAETALGLGRDRDSYRTLMAPLAARWEELSGEILAPAHVPRHPLLLARFGFFAAAAAEEICRQRFSHPRARALFAGISAHSGLALSRAPSAAFGLMLALAGHARGWPVPRGGSQAITEALLTRLRGLGGTLVTGRRVHSLAEIPGLALLDIPPIELLRLAGPALPESYARSIRAFRYGCGVHKVDWALSAPIPWKAPECSLSATVHLGGEWEEIARSESQAESGEAPDRPFVLVTQPSLFDPTRAPPGRHTAWAYCHVPFGSGAPMREKIEAQIERFAPGFSETILARHELPPAALERMDSNLVGGVITGGRPDLAQLFTRPVARLDPYSTPLPGIYLCSAFTPPGAGVHGMCGYHAAASALRHRHGSRFARRF